MPKSFEHDPDARLDYTWDWSEWLAPLETVQSSTVTVETGMIVDGSPIILDGVKVVAFLQGGTLGQIYRATCHIVTSVGRQDDKSIVINVRQK